MEWVEDDWPVDAYVLRVAPEEHESLAALQGLGLETLTIPLAREDRAYRWFRRAAGPAVRRTGEG